MQSGGQGGRGGRVRPESGGHPESWARPRIGLTLMVDEPERDTHLPRYGMNRSYFAALRNAGGVPVPLAPGAAEELALYFRDPAAPEIAPPFELDGLCLAGGGDLEPSHFGQERHPLCGRPDVERDRMEMTLLDLIRPGQIPVLAICRGIQVLNVAWGGTLIQDIASQRPEAAEHYYKAPSPRDHPAHPIRIAPESRLARILGCTTLTTNSIHHQAVDLLGDGLAATAWAPDGIIEGLEAADREDRRYLIAVQFHPEDLVALAPIRRLFASLVAAAREYRDARA
jgi:putative glutamine amidotransferase